MNYFTSKVFGVSGQLSIMNVFQFPINEEIQPLFALMVWFCEGRDHLRPGTP